MERLQGRVLNYNKKAIKFISEDLSPLAFPYLNKALKKLRCIADSPLKRKLLSYTFNNLGSYYKKTQNSKLAVNNMLKAAQYADNAKTLGGIFLNLSTVYLGDR